MHATDLDRKRAVPGRCAAGDRGRARTAAGRDRRLPSDHLGTHAEERDPEEERPDERAAPQPTAATRRRTAVTKPTVRVDGWEQHRHRVLTLSQSERPNRAVAPVYAS